jgi:glutamyl-tRNA synthetase
MGGFDASIRSSSTDLKTSGKGKLSKRDGDQEGFPVFPLEWRSPEGEIASGYREWGYFPEALINLLAFLGWNPGTEQEIFSLEELTTSFSLERVNKSGARFDPEKAKWFNQQYLQQRSDSELAKQFIEQELRKRGVEASLDHVVKIIGQVKERAVFISDFWEQSAFYFTAPDQYDENAIKKCWKEETPGILKSCLELLKNTEPFSSGIIESELKHYIETMRWDSGK